MIRAVIILILCLLPGCQTLSDSMQAARINRALQQADAYFHPTK